MSHLAAASNAGAAGSQLGSGAAPGAVDHAVADPRSAAAPSASASSSSAAAASGSGSPRLFDLSDKTRESVGIPEDVWVKNYSSSLVPLLLELSPRSAVLALIVYFQATENASLAFLTELRQSNVKKVCAHIGVKPGKNAADCVVAITESIQLHMEHYPHLVDSSAASKSTAASRSASDQMELGYESPEPNQAPSSSSSSDSEHQEPQRAKSGRPRAAAAAAAPPSPARRSSRVPQSPARASKHAPSSSSSSLKPSSSHRSKVHAGVLAALASIPGAPSDDDAASAPRSKSGRKVSMARDLADGRKSKKGKGAKRDKKHEKKSKKTKSKSRRKQSSDEDSDSDGPGGRGASSSDESSDSPSSSSSASSSSASSSSDSDDSSSRRYRKRKHASSMESNGLTKSLAKPWIHNALASTEFRGTILDIHKDKTYKTERNKRECETLSKIIDCLRKHKQPGNIKRALEFAVRRLVGVQTADMSGNWAVCDQFELVMDKQSFVPDEVLARALKNAARLESLEHAARPGRRGAGAGNAAAASSSSHNKSGAAGSGKKKNKPRGRGPPRDRSPDSRGPGSNSTKSDKESKGPRK